MEANFRMRSIISILKFKKLIDVFEKFIYEKNWGDRVHVGILPLNLARISSIYRLTGSFVVCGLCQSRVLYILFRYHIDMCLWNPYEVLKGMLNPHKTKKLKLNSL